jgi:DNA-damage-inducible protein D
VTDAELIFTALAELATRQIAETLVTVGLEENKIPASQGGRISKNARLELENKTGRKVVSGDNYKISEKKRKKINGKKR